MPEIERPGRQVLVEYTCDQCAIGKLAPTGFSYMTKPPTYEHQCNNCGAVKDLSEIYPVIRFVPD
jgi:hypothetical protein